MREPGIFEVPKKKWDAYKTGGKYFGSSKELTGPNFMRGELKNCCFSVLQGEQDPAKGAGQFFWP